MQDRSKARGERRLEVAEDPAFQRRPWTVQRIGWAAAVALLVAALLGVFGGPGPLADADVGRPDAVRVEHPRFLRHGSATDFRVTVGGLHVTTAPVELAWSRGYLERFDLEHVTPEPDEVVADRDSVTFRLRRAASAAGPGGRRWNP